MLDASFSFYFLLQMETLFVVCNRLGGSYLARVVMKTWTSC